AIWQSHSIGRSATAKLGAIRKSISAWAPTDPSRRSLLLEDMTPGHPNGRLRTRVEAACASEPRWPHRGRCKRFPRTRAVNMRIPAFRIARRRSCRVIDAAIFTKALRSRSTTLPPGCEAFHWVTRRHVQKSTSVTRPEPEIWKIEPVLRYALTSTVCISSLGTVVGFTPNQIE